MTDQLLVDKTVALKALKLVVPTVAVMVEPLADLRALKWLTSQPSSQPSKSIIFSSHWPRQ